MSGDPAAQARTHRTIRRYSAPRSGVIIRDMMAVRRPRLEG
jgi:hypothetical protein